MGYALVIVDISGEALDRPFSYLVPESMSSDVRPGVVVRIPFGSANRERKGYVIGLTDQPGIETDKIKEIRQVLVGAETEESRLIALAAWMKDTYGCTMIQALKTCLPIRMKVRREAEAYLCRLASAERIEELLSEMSPARFRARIRVLGLFLDRERVSLGEARQAGMTPRILAYLEENGIAALEKHELWRNPVKGEGEEDRASLTLEQQKVIAGIREEWQGKRRPVLLMGVTGSGKTLVYLELIQEIVGKGKEAIVLIPEIALTFQTVERFRRRFGSKVSFIHSRLSAGERYDQFARAKKGEVHVMVGPRSALFTPFPDLGLIVIDEEHETSYKSETAPRYLARETAIRRAQMEDAMVVLGSATPSLETYHRAAKGEYRLELMKRRYMDRPMAAAKIIDMRKELREGNRSPLSRLLQEELQKCLDQKDQAMLFLNRRGYAGFISCRSCGHVVKCPHCDVSLSHHNGNIMVCHYCGYTRELVKVCPVCGSEWIGGFKAGTQQIESVVKKLFPHANVLRMDYDTTRKKGSYESILSAFSRHEADILIGTQMIVKGHDFPEVTLVGALAADMSLGSGDYRCAERTFQLLAQAAGRAGRGERAGMAVFQTYQPEHYSIMSAADQDYPSFYQEEISFRELMGYPPASCLMTVMGSGLSQEKLAMAMKYIRLYLEQRCSDGKGTVIGPAPALVGKIKDTYHMVLYVKHPDVGILSVIREKLDRYIGSNTGFLGLRIQYDMN